MQDNNFIHEEAPNVTSVESPHSEDPFNIYELLQKKKNDVASISKESDPIYPPGFTPANATHKNGEDTTSVNDQCLKSAMKTWVKDSKSKKNEAKSYVQDKLTEVDKHIDQVGDVLELSQKAKVGSKVTKTQNIFMGLLITKDLNLPFAGFLSMLISDPKEVKAEFLNHFAKQFSKPSSHPVSIDADIHQFFDSGKFPPGCNSSFIALIPKIQDAKIVKDFRPIDVQTAFVSNRQILDGPFILNELLAWCKHKKVNAMIFKVDFEKTFDSVRWDYLDDVLRSFGFGDKWRKWISGCLNS
ncbi:RNA-directed DNA polymerase, eukaryota, partial [Tanacetum coccineum]